MAKGKTGKLIIHAGDHKAGSTALQYAFVNKAVRLSGATLSYPTALNANQVFDPLKPKNGGTAKPARIKGLAKRIAKDAADYTVVSAESLDSARPKLVKEICDTYFAPIADQIAVISYVRPHAARVVSSFAEITKIGGETSTLEAFHKQTLRGKRFVYTPRFSAWLHTFGDDFMLRPMVRDQLEGASVVDDFAAHAFPEVKYRIKQVKTGNESASLRQLMVFRVLHQRLNAFPPGLRLAVGWSVAKHLAANDAMQGPKLYLHQALLRKVHKDYIDDARSMDQKFFGGRPVLATELEAALDQAPVQKQSLVPQDHLSSDEIALIHAMGDHTAEMLRLEADWNKHFRKGRIEAAKPD